MLTKKRFLKLLSKVKSQVPDTEIVLYWLLKLNSLYINIEIIIKKRILLLYSERKDNDVDCVIFINSV